MTKTVRVENADNGTAHKVVVQEWEKGVDGAPDTLVTEHALDYPTALATVYITTTRYLVVKEAS